MATILLTNSVPSDPILRQVPQRDSRWCNHRFVQQPGGEQIDAWVVYDNLPQPETIAIDRRRTLLITGEPPSVRRYREDFTSQFGAVRTSHQSVNHPQVVRGHEAQNWHYGMNPNFAHESILDYDALADLTPTYKTKLLSVVASNNNGFGSSNTSNRHSAIKSMSLVEAFET
jgi:hypothetical protein